MSREIASKVRAQKVGLFGTRETVDDAVKIRA